MRYMGSKRRHAKELLPIILQDRQPNRYYVEPFAGGFNMIDKVDGKRLANDVNHYVIDMFTALVGGWIPPDAISEKEYYTIKHNKHIFPNHLVGFVGFGCAFGGIWFGTYARNDAKNDYCLQSKNSVLKQAANLKGVLMTSACYTAIDYPRSSTIYCDPPYANTAQYKDSFDHAIFWEWVRMMSKRGHDVYVSEYNAPDDFIVLWEKQTITNINGVANKQKPATEKLFKYAG